MKTNDAIVSELLEMNGGVGFDTEDLFNAMNEGRADERIRVAKELNPYVECMVSVMTSEQMKQVADMLEGLEEQNNE